MKFCLFFLLNVLNSDQVREHRLAEHLRAYS